MAKPITFKILGDASDLQKALGQAESGLSKLGKVAGAAALATAGAATGVAVATANAAIDFESEMGQVFTLLPGISEDAMSEMEGQVLDFSKQMGLLPSDVIPALYDALSAGVPQDNVFEFLETAGQAAIGGNLEVADSVDLLSTAMNAYASTGLTAEEASDAFFTTVRLGKTTVPELQSAFSNVGPVAAALGVGLDEVGASLAVLTASGVPTAQATTQIRGAIAELGKSGSVASKAFEDISGKTFPEFIEQGGSFQEALMLMAESGDPVIDMFGSIEAAQAVMALTANEGEALASAMEEMGNATGATTDAFNVMDATTKRDMERIKANIAAVGVQLGQKLLPIVADVTTWIVDNWPEIEAVFQALAEFVVEDLVPAIQTFVEKSIEVFEDFMAGVDLIWENVEPIFRNLMTAFEGVFLFFRGVWDTFMGAFKGDWRRAWNGIKSIFEGVWKIIKGLFGAAWENLKLQARIALEALRTTVGNLAGKVKDKLVERFTAAKDAVVRVIKELPRNMREAINDAIFVVKQKASAVFNAFKGLGSQIMQGLKSALSSTAGFAGDVASAVLRAVKDVINRFVIDKINSALEFKIDIPGPIPDIHVNPPNIPRLQHGGTLNGMALVGERGPELVRLGNSLGGADVIPNRERGAMGANINVNVQGSTASPHEIGASVVWAMRRAG